MSQEEPGIVISLSNDMMTSEQQMELREMQMSILGVLQMVQLTRFTFRDVARVIEGDLIALVSLTADIMLLIVKIRMFTEFAIAKKAALVAHIAMLNAANAQLAVGVM